ncbi:hypothetical protein AVEN_161985-1 [Araneus ventricosus]|uniref:Uncharacterized protein n=1 Tax=Araneus ventricosus TaxID=182803 RepID=A0A4Y2V0J8_ARAVE|nr:hypothetical protein AVEN_161985-1 [Araneus ventricosus]
MGFRSWDPPAPMSRPYPRPPRPQWFIKMKVLKPESIPTQSHTEDNGSYKDKPQNSEVLSMETPNHVDENSKLNKKLIQEGL